MTPRSILKFLLTDNGWKAAAINALICAVVLALLSSFLFDLAVSLIKLVLLVGLIAFAIRSAYLAYPLLEEKTKTL